MVKKNRSKVFWGISDLGNTIHGVGNELAGSVSQVTNIGPVNIYSQDRNSIHEVGSDLVIGGQVSASPEIDLEI